MQEVINVESWIYNLTEANENDSKSPNWFKQFSLKESFELDDLSPATMTKFVDQLAGNKTKLQQVYILKIDVNISYHNNNPNPSRLLSFSIGNIK